MAKCIFPQSPLQGLVKDLKDSKSHGKCMVILGNFWSCEVCQSCKQQFSLCVKEPQQPVKYTWCISSPLVVGPSLLQAQLPGSFCAWLLLPAGLLSNLDREGGSGGGWVGESYLSSDSLLRRRWRDKVLGGEPNSRFQAGGFHTLAENKYKRSGKGVRKPKRKKEEYI